MSVARWLETDTFTDKDISSAVAIGAYTADADRMIVCDVSLGSIAGNGDYVIYVTRQIGGAGSAYVMLPKTTCAAASGETAIAMQSAAITVRSGDVLTVYLDGLAGDTTTPDTTVRWFEMAALRPTTADRTLDVSATGEAGLDFDNRKDTNSILPSDAAGSLGGLPLLDGSSLLPANVVRWDGNNMAGTLPALQGADGDTLKTLSDQIDGISAGGATAQEVWEYTTRTLTQSSTGSGATAYSITVQDEDSNPIDGVEVWITTDSAGTNVVAGTLSTDALGLATFMLDAGDYYVWRQRSGYNFTNPVAITVS